MKYLRRFLIGLGCFYVLLVAFLYVSQEKMLFLPDPLPSDFQYCFATAFEEINVEVDDSVTLNALHFSSENPKGILVYYHGNAGDLSRWGRVMQDYIAYGYDVLVYDYRSYGKSSGSIDETKFYLDAQKIYDVAKRYFSEEEITVYGRSLGTTFATFVASKNQPRQLILEAPFFSIEDVAKRRFPIIPVGSLLKFHMPTYAFMREVACPVTIFHGTEDPIVPISSGRRLFDSIPKGLGSFHELPEVGHMRVRKHPQYEPLMKALLP
ncbi:alpha/beta hydrolase [Altibacter sp. HG106]|uniref:alpha/beta hydrolase n=1 Tax=Altibacter sp. HG106 TaxID=3023937 RepID=UPI0023510046|nr:alpha/beta fold hydrolase [Altibacter sp. HG106]MDC7993635.1 alpha/beta fold hydrolase [Altibacter sp. HG106]